MINRDGGSFRIESIPIDDAATYKLYAAGDTMGVFQVEGAGMRRALIELKPDRFEDIIALVALYRPGPMDNIPTFCDRKHGREEVEYPHEAIASVLDETYGIIVYQEQVMQIAQLLSGYSLGEADLLRRAMGKKIKAEMDAQRDRFRDGCVRQGIKKAQADSIFDLLAKFANYGFNKSHAATYALVSYQTAYLKAHYPKEFLAASMTLDMGNTDKLAEFRQESKRRKIGIIPPCINRSDAEFSVKDGQIAYGLCAVKGIGEQVAEHIVEVRGDRPYSDLGDFATRVDPRIVNRRTLETLVNAGAFDQLVPRREQAFAVIDQIIGTAQRLSTDKSAGITDMFASDSPEPVRLPVQFDAWTLTQRLEREFAAVGFHLSAHPLDIYADLFERLRVQRWMDFERAVADGATAGRLAGTVSARQDRRTRKGAPMVILTLTDQTGSFECMVFSEQIARFGSHLSVGANLLLAVEADQRPDGVSVRLLSAEPLGEAADKVGRRLTVFASDEKCLAPIRAQLKPGGEGAVSLIVIRDGGSREYEIELPGTFRVNAEIAGGIKALSGVTDVRLN